MGLKRKKFKKNWKGMAKKFFDRTKHKILIGLGTEDTVIDEPFEQKREKYKSLLRGVIELRQEGKICSPSFFFSSFFFWNLNCKINFVYPIK